MRKTLLAVGSAAVALFAAAACTDANTLAMDQTQVLAAATDQLGNMMDTTFGVAGRTSSDAAATIGGSAPALAPAAIDSVTAPLFWGRLRIVPGGPRPIFHRDVTVQGDSAWVELTVTFQGLFLVDTSADTTFNPSAKPLDVQLHQSAVFVRDAQRPHGWRAVELSLQNWQDTDLSTRTVDVTQVQVSVNGVVMFTATDPDSLYDVVNRIPRLHLGDTISVTASVSNTTGGSFVPPTFVFLHVRHANLSGVYWRRVPMRDNGDGTYSRTWIARSTGVDRFVVDAIDANTLELGNANNYRANEWGIPYRIE